MYDVVGLPLNQVDSHVDYQQTSPTTWNTQMYGDYYWHREGAFGADTGGWYPVNATENVDNLCGSGASGADPCQDLSDSVSFGYSGTFDQTGQDYYMAWANYLRVYPARSHWECNWSWFLKKDLFFTTDDYCLTNGIPP